MYNETDINFLKLAFEEAKESKANRLKVGAVLVSYQGEYLNRDHNRMPHFMNQDECEDEIDGKLVTKPELIHAEANLLVGCTMATFEGTLYVTDSPCIHCAKLIYQSGIKRVVYSGPYRLTDGIDFLKKAGIEVIQIPFGEVYNS